MPKTLLLADDSITIQRVVGITFANEDYEITTVDNGDDAIIKAVEIKPDIILADVIMPKKNGYEVCQAVKSNPELNNIPVLLLAGTFEAFDENRARDVGANGHITKPFESQALIDKVNELVKTSSQAPAPDSLGPAAIPQPTLEPLDPEIEPPLSKPAMPRTPPPPPNIPASMHSNQQPKQTPFRSFGEATTQPGVKTPQPAPISPPEPKIPSPEILPLENEISPPPKPLDAEAVKATPINHTPFESNTWETGNQKKQDVDFLEPLGEESDTQETDFSSNPISLESAQAEPITLEAESIEPLEPLDTPMPNEPSIDEPWPSTPFPSNNQQSSIEDKSFEPLDLPVEPAAPLDNSITSGSLDDLTQPEIPPIDIEDSIQQDIDLDPPELAPAHEFVTPKQPPEEPQKTAKLPAETPSISLEEAKKIAAQTIEKIAWEIVPQLAEAIIREEIEKLIQEKLKD